jgi:hypothetical protein
MAFTLRPLLLAIGLAVLLAPACSLGQGTGCVAGNLDVLDCWSGLFNLHPDFFSANPTNGGGLQIRIQNGIDYETFSDGIVILVDDLGEVRGDPGADGTPHPPLLGQSLVVGLPPGVTPPGVPVRPVANPTIVHATLYLEHTCRPQNVALYALDAVTLEADGTCNRPVTGEPAPACGAPATLNDAGIVVGSAGGGTDGGADASVEAGSSSAIPADGGPGLCGIIERQWPTNVATSTITFRNLFDGNPGESNAQQRLSDGDFDFYLADPREVCPGGLGPPPPCRGHVQGSFHFFFQRGRPAQPFP